MRKCFLSVLLLLAMPAFATITKIQSNATWSTSGTSCSVGLTSTANQHLLVVWATWSPSTLTALVNDSPNNNSFSGAVGPTTQSASNTAAQIFYAKNINGVTSDNIQVNFSGGTASTASCVAVEYSGADQNYPLDSVSAAYSYSPGSTLDSGTAAPANANLLVFGGGTTDTGTASALSPPWTTIQNHSGSVTEQMIVTGNNALQRATASSTSTGNWVMQMAVFRDAYWTVAGGWRPARVGKLLYADQFPGGDIGGQINTAITQLPTVGGVPAGVVSLEGYSGIVTLSTPIVLNSHFVSLVGPGRE